MLTKEQVLRLQRLVREGLPVAHIASEIGCGRTRVYAEKRRMERKARGKNGTRVTVHKTRPGDPLGAFRERARKIELVERIQGIKKQTEEAANGVDLADSERERLIALAKQGDAAVDMMASLSASDAAAVTKELETRSGVALRRISTRVDLDHRLSVGRGRLGQLNRQLTRLERERQNREMELRDTEKQIAAKKQQLGLMGDLEAAKRTLAQVNASISAQQATLRNSESLVALVKERAYLDWMREVTSSYEMTDIERAALNAVFLRHEGFIKSLQP